MDARPRRLDIYRTALPMRSFEHAAARRDVAEAIVARLELTDGRAGWGETLPRPYVTGETMESVVDDLEHVLWPAMLAAAVTGAPAERLREALPLADPAGRRIPAARCAMELALYDALPMARPRRGPIAARVSGVLGSSDPSRTARRLRLMRWFGLRDFKLKLGLGKTIDAENLRLVAGKLSGAIRAGKCTLRVDVNGAWDAASTPVRVAELAQLGVCAVEQPVFRTAAEFVELARRCELPLIADESLVTADDARALLAEPRRVWWNVRISKNGGLDAAAELAAMAARHGVPFVVGCMVGESGILSAAQRRLLEALPAGPRFVEGNYGRFLLAEDLTAPSRRFSYGGKLKALSGPGLGVKVDVERVKRRGELVRTLDSA